MKQGMELCGDLEEGVPGNRRVSAKALRQEHVKRLVHWSRKDGGGAGEESRRR